MADELLAPGPDFLELRDGGSVRILSAERVDMATGGLDCAGGERARVPGVDGVLRRSDQQAGINHNCRRRIRLEVEDCRCVRPEDGYEIRRRLGGRRGNVEESIVLAKLDLVPGADGLTHLQMETYDSVVYGLDRNPHGILHRRAMGSQRALD